MDSKWLPAEPNQPPGASLWRASWANTDPRNALVHQYFFAAADMEAAHAKIFGWLSLPAHSLPVNARIIQKNWHSSSIPGHTLPVWHITWLENQEKHALFLFEPADYEGAAHRARIWARQRYETLDDFQMLIRLDGRQRDLALFNPAEGRAIFVL